MPMQITIPDQLIKWKESLFRPIEEDGFKGWVPYRLPLEVKEQSPTICWVGDKIPLSLWHQLCAFFEVQFAQTGGEAQAQLFYSVTRRLWKVWVFPQEWSSGMSSVEIAHEGDCVCLHCGNWKAQREALFAETPDLKVYGSVHHHCRSTAFQSGTDHANEHHRNGLHITIGQLGSKEYDLHGRVYLAGIEYDCGWEAWFDLDPPWLAQVPEALRESIREGLLCAPPPKETAFPRQWLENLIKRETTPVRHHSDVYGGHWDNEKQEWIPHAQETTRPFPGGPLLPDPPDAQILSDVLAMAQLHKLSPAELREALTIIQGKAWNARHSSEAATRFQSALVAYTSPRKTLTPFKVAQTLLPLLISPEMEKEPTPEADTFTSNMAMDLAVLAAELELDYKQVVHLVHHLSAFPQAGQVCDAEGQAQDGNGHILLDDEVAFMEGMRETARDFGVTLEEVCKVAWKHLDQAQITSARAFVLARSRGYDGSDRGTHEGYLDQFLD